MQNEIDLTNEWKDNMKIRVCKNQIGEKLKL